MAWPQTSFRRPRLGQRSGSPVLTISAADPARPSDPLSGPVGEYYNSAARPHRRARLPSLPWSAEQPAKSRNPHSSATEARGFVLRGLPYACRRPELFTEAAGPPTTRLTSEAAGPPVM